MGVMKKVFVFAALLMASLAFGGSITVTSPNNGDFLGRSNTLSFQIKNSVVKAKITATIVFDADPSVRFTPFTELTPDTDGNINGSISLQFNDSTPNGPYTITVVVDEPGNSYNTEVRNVTIDTKNPEFVEVQPIAGAYVKGVIPIRVKLREESIKEWRVKVNSQDIPNNSGTSSTFTVNWDTSNIERDGSQTISIDVTDRAGNSSNKQIQVTLDRISPVATILTPGNGSTLRPRSNIPVAINFVDQANGSVNVTGVDVVLRGLDGRFLGRAARKNVRQTGNTLEWNGRILWTKSLPATFKVVVSVVDRAGNSGTQQEVTITVRK